MTTPTAEVMITPEVSRNAIMQMQRDFDKAFKKIADDAQRKIDDSVRDGVRNGARKSRGAFRNMFRGAGQAIGRGVDSLGGARAIGGSILGLGLVSYLDRIDKADQGQALIAQLLAENNAQRQIATAEGAGLTLEQFAQFSRTLQQGGFRDQQEINDVIFDIQERAEGARRGEETFLKNYTGLQGQDLLNSVLAGISQLGQGGQQRALADLGFGGEVGQNLQRVIQNAERQSLINRGLEVTDENLATVTGQQVLEVLNEQNKTEGERLADQLQKEADLTEQFRQREQEFQDETRQKLFAQIDDGKLDTFFTEREREARSQEKLLEDFNENMVTAQAARETIKTLMSGLNETVKIIEKSVVGIANYLGVDTGTRAEKEAANNVRNPIKAPTDSAISTEQLTRSINNIKI